MSSYSGKVNRKQGGDELEVEVGGTITVGDVTITRDAAGNTYLNNLPTEDPGVAGTLWDNSGALSVSQGT